VLRISAGNQHILLTADIKHKSEQRLLKEHTDKLPAALLVVPHPGSKTSSTAGFVSAVPQNILHSPPDIAIASNIKIRRYKTLRRLRRATAALGQEWRNLGRHGCKGLQVERYRNTHRRYWTHSPLHLEKHIGKPHCQVHRLT